MPRKPFVNTFTWSKSRAGFFNECLRKYRYQYYDYWNGWLDDAPEQARRLYKLRALATIPSWRGLVVHDTLEYILKDFHRTKFRKPLALEAAMQFAEDKIRNQWHTSSRKRYWSLHKKDPAWFGLVEHELGVDLPESTLPSIIASVNAQLATVYNSALWQRIVESDRDNWYSIDDRAFFLLDGVKIWAVPDLMYTRCDGAIVILDWKTGEPRPDEEKRQLAAYAAYAHLEHNIPLNKMICNLVYTRGPQLDEVAWVPTMDEIKQFGQYARKSMGQMAELLVQADTPEHTVESNVLLPILNFPKTEDTRKCTRCAFNSECWPKEPFDV